MTVNARKVGGFVSIANWNLDSFDECGALLKPLVGKAVDEAISTIIGEKIECGFNQKEPDEINFWLPFDAFEGDFGGPQFTINLSEALNDSLDAALYCGPHGGMADHIDLNLTNNGHPLYVATP